MTHVSNQHSQALYDQVTYDTQAFPETHPHNLAVLGRLFGLASPDPERCRVLELGAASGGNLIPLAWQLADSQFVGVELSPVQVALGQRVIEAVELQNMQLHVADILELDSTELGQFDYIIVHGVYSWVPGAVQQRILELIQHCLHPQGLAYVSYNVLPGWRMRGALRDLLLYACREATSAAAKLQVARRALLRLQAVLQESPQHSAHYTLAELDYLLQASPSYLLHEYLAPYNQPLLFSEFVQALQQQGLSYVCETDLHTLFDSTLAPSAQQALADIEAVLEHEQWMDFARMRSFRQSVVCHSAALTAREIDVDVLRSCAFSARLQALTEPNLAQIAVTHFQRVDQLTFPVEHPLTKAALLILATHYPRRLAFVELLSLAQAQVRTAGGGLLADQHAALVAECFNLYSYRALGLWLQADSTVESCASSEYPHASLLVRVQASQGWHSIATVLHVKLELDEFARALLPLLDGTRTVPELCTQLAEQWPLETPEVLGANVQRLLQLFKRHGLLDAGPPELAAH